MADNLPLIPRKGAACADVRPVLREVFRDRDYLPPLPTDKDAVQQEDPLSKHWIKDYSLQCNELWQKEDELKREHASRVAREPLPNIYRLSSPMEKAVPAWRLKHGLIARKDLIPAVHQNAAGDGNLWVKNILNRSSCDVSLIEVRGSRLRIPAPLPSADEQTNESLSIGEVTVPPPPVPPTVEILPPPPEYVLCIPPHLEFVNFTVGQLHTQSVRVVNISKFEVRLSLQPPQRSDLNVMLVGPRGLALTAGSAVELRVRFTPRDVRTVRDALVVRANTGKTMVVPIHCYMQPPVLEVMVPNLTWSSLSCTPGETSVTCGKRDVLELGARLLGDVHCARLLLNCDSEHASFFIVTEDAWLSYCLDTLTCDGAVVCGSFTVSPAWWRGGGAIRGGAWCRATTAGLHAAALRVISSTAVVRPLHLLADALYFTTKHLTLEAHEKDYDICSEDDPACEYYVNLGTAFPNRSLSAIVQLVNHSPVVYSYYWSVRPWGVCSCWEDERALEGSVRSDDDSDRLCIGAKEARQKGDSRSPGPETLTRIQPEHGRVAARASCALHVCAPDVGGKLGPQRAVLMLILKDIPKESFPPDANLMVVKTDMVISDPIPGHEPWSREVCEVVCLQLEVWWEVVPARFVLDPPLLHLPHSRRVKEVEVCVRATQLFGREGVKASWTLPEGKTVASTAATLAPAHSLAVALNVTLPSLPNESSVTDVIELTAEGNEWRSQMSIIRRCATRHPRLRPARAFLGIVSPAAHLTTAICLYNDTHQHICWWGNVYRWWGENEPSAWCVGQSPCEHCRERACTCALLWPSRGALHCNETQCLTYDVNAPEICWWGNVYRWWGENEPSAWCVGQSPCEHCRERACTCALLRPSRGALHCNETQCLTYDVNAPDKDGCVATVIQARRTAGDVAQVPSSAGSEGRASLVFYRVLAPRIVLRVLPCHGDKVPGECEICSLDMSCSPGGSAVLRPSSALCVGRCTCYRLRFTNITPLPTSIAWEEPIEKEDTIKVAFIPNDFDVGSYGKVEIRMVIKTLRVCGRRLFVYRAKVAYSSQPLYLIVDTAVAGLAVSYEVPLGGGTIKEGSLIMKATQKEQFPWEPPPRRPAAEEAFLEEDRKRAVRAENICHCRFKMVHIPKVKPLKPPKEESEVSSIEIITEPPPLTRVCPCDACSKPTIPDFETGCLQFRDLPLRTVTEPQPLTRVCPCDVCCKTTIPDFEESGCLQFRDLPLRTVRSRTIVVRNESVLATRWQATVRNWPRKRSRVLATDPWAVDLQDPGVAIELIPAGGVLGPRACVDVTVSVYADCWGLYRDQILVMIDKLEPLVLDVWVEAVGRPLSFSMKPSRDGDDAFTLWMSSSDPNRIVRVKNTSRSELVVHSYVLLDNDHPQDVLPFRLYLRFFDVLPKFCPCVNAFDSHELSFDEEAAESIPEAMDTGVEVFLTADYGPQADTCFKVEPEVATIAPGAYEHLHVTFDPPKHNEPAPDAMLLLRPLPTKQAGPGWYRREPGPQIVRLRAVQRAGLLRASVCKVHVKYCALGLPQDDVLRIRKTFQIQNAGDGHLYVEASTEGAWSILADSRHHGVCGAGCCCVPGGKRPDRLQQIALHYQPMSSNEMAVEVCVRTCEAWPRPDCKVGAPPAYEPHKKTVTPLYFYDEDNVLMTIPLILELEYPIVMIEPLAGIDFGFVTDGDTRKSYFTVSHTSRSEIIELVISWIGSADFRLWPEHLSLEPGAAGRVYVQYISKWRSGSVEGVAHVSARGGAGVWCRASVVAKASPARDYHRHAPPHDHTDDENLLPPGLVM